jgi:phytoene dehydrogenase-like protein
LLQDQGAGVPIGGMTTLVQALSSYIDSHAGNSITNEDVTEILVRDGTAYGVKTKTGKTFEARKGIVASVEPKALFLKLIPDAALDQQFKKTVKSFRYSKVTQVMIHAALDEWLDYRPNEARNSGLVQIGDSLDQISRAFNDCIIGQPPREPFMTIDNTTCYDSSRAPAGKHIMWNFVRAPVLVNGAPWTADQKEKFADLCIERLTDYAPNAKRIILKRVVLSPQDLERINPNLVNGDPGAGKATMDQSLALKPFPKWSEYRTPIKALYMCSPATHPGGGVSGLAGHNAAMMAIEDLKAAQEQ